MRRQWVQNCLRFGISLAIALVLTQFRFDFLEGVFFDLRTRFRPQAVPSGHVKLIMVDSKTVSASQGIPGFKEHAKLLKLLAQHPPKAVVYIRQFAALKKESAQMGDDNRGHFFGNPAEQKEFVEAASQLPNFFAQTDTLKHAADPKNLQLVEPFADLNVGSGPRTSDRFILARDGVFSPNHGVLPRPNSSACADRLAVQF